MKTTILTGLLCIMAIHTGDSRAQVEDFDSIQLFTLKNQAGMTVKATNYGAIITSILVPDRDGALADVALGYDRLKDYTNAVDKPYFGAVGRIGREAASFVHPDRSEELRSVTD